MRKAAFFKLFFHARGEMYDVGPFFLRKNNMSTKNFDHVSPGRGNPAVSIPRYEDTDGYRAKGDYVI